MIYPEIRKSTKDIKRWVVDSDLSSYVQPDGTIGGYVDYKTEAKAQTAVDLFLAEQDVPESFSDLDIDPTDEQLIPVSHKDYMSLSDACDKHSRELMTAKGEEYAISGDFLAMENRLAGMLGCTPEHVSLVMAGKHIVSLGIILEKNDVTQIKLEKWDERIRDGMNLLKIASAFVHAKQNDFSLHLGKEEKPDRIKPIPGDY